MCDTNKKGLIYLCIGIVFTIPLVIVPFYYNDAFNSEIPWWGFPEFPPILIIEIPLFCGFIFFIWRGFRIICLPIGAAVYGKWESVGHSNMTGTFYLNLLVDLNHDGFWGGEFNGSPEWVIPNEEIIIDSTTPRFEHCIPEHAYLSQTWMRAAITTTSITSSDWDGTGEFNSGEIEDHILLPIDRTGPGRPCTFHDCGPNGGVPSYNATTLSAPTGPVAPPVFDPTDAVNITGVDGVPGSFDVTGELTGPQDFVATCPTVSSSGPSHMYPVSTTCLVRETIVVPGEYCWDITITETTGNYDPSMVALLDDIPDECFMVVKITVVPPCTFHDCGNGVVVVRP